MTPGTRGNPKDKANAASRALPRKSRTPLAPGGRGVAGPRLG